MATILKILIEKEYLAITVYGRNHQYYSLVSKETYSKRSMKNFIKGYFDGSFSSAVSFMGAVWPGGRLAKVLGGRWLGRVVPGVIGDPIYDWVQRNRLRWFGSRAVCFVPEPNTRARFA